MASLLDFYANQSITWKQRTGNDRYGQPSYAADATIAARWNEQRRMVRNPMGEEVVSEASCQTTAAVKVGDRLVDVAGRTWEILAVSISYDLDGVEQFRIARV